MEQGRRAVVSFKDDFIEGTIVAVAVNDEQRHLYKAESSSPPKGPMWIPAERVYRIEA